MTSRLITIAGYVAAVAAGVALEVAARHRGSRVPRIRRVFSRVMRTRAGRVGVMAGWAWLGLHLFSR